MRARWIVTAVAIIGLVAASAHAAEEVAPSGFVVIVNPAHPGTAVGRVALERIFLGQASHWGDETVIIPIDLSLRSPTRQAFSSAVLQRSVGAVAKYWLDKRQRLRPPTVRGSESEVVEFVASTPGAIGYVSATTMLDGSVKVLEFLED